MFVTGWIFGIIIAIPFWYFAMYLPQQKHLNGRLDSLAARQKRLLEKKIEEKRRELNNKKEKFKKPPNEEKPVE